MSKRGEMCCPVMKYRVQHGQNTKLYRRYSYQGDVFVWGFCLGVLFGGFVWGFCLVFFRGVLFGGFVWGFCLGALFGGFVWGFCLGVLFGGFVWGLCLGVLFGGFVWGFCLGVLPEKGGKRLFLGSIKKTANFAHLPSLSNVRSA